MVRTFLIGALFALYLNGMDTAFAQSNVPGDSVKATWNGKSVKLTLKEDRDKVISGKIITTEKNGIVFDPKRYSPFYDPKERLYLFAEIEKIVGDDGKILFELGQALAERLQVDRIEEIRRAARQQEMASQPLYNLRLRLNVEIGYSRRLDNLTAGAPDDLQNYAKSLQTGVNFSGDAAYFFSNRYGLGFRYARFSSSNEKQQVVLADENGQPLGPGTLRDDITISFLGPGLYYRDTFGTQRLFLVAGLFIGKITYQDDASFLEFPFNIKGNSFGLSGMAGIDFIVVKDFAVGFEISYLLGEISNVTVNGQSGLIGESESMGRIDFNIGMKLYR